MKRVMLAVLVFGVSSCAVENTGVSISTSTDDVDAPFTSSEAASSVLERDATPSTAPCLANCDFPVACHFDGGHEIAGTCDNPKEICCDYEPR
jgi:hypothetical protein